MTGMKADSFDLRTEDRRHGKQKLRQTDDDTAEIIRLCRNQIRQHGGQTDDRYNKRRQHIKTVHTIDRKLPTTPQKKGRQYRWTDSCKEDGLTSRKDQNEEEEEEVDDHFDSLI